MSDVCVMLILAGRTLVLWRGALIQQPEGVSLRGEEAF